jgi:predicted anti-sigma-YlaC factor YlaD
MLRAIGGVVLGYIVMFVTLFITMTLAYAIIGTGGAFKEASYDVSTLWVITTIVLSLAAAIVGGLVCAAVAESAGPARVLAGLVVVLGLVMAIPALRQAGPLEEARPDSVSNMEAMMNARQPSWIALLDPIIGGVGVLAGAALLGRPRPPETRAS